MGGYIGVKFISFKLSGIPFDPSGGDEICFNLKGCPAVPGREALPCPRQTEALQLAGY